MNKGSENDWSCTKNSCNAQTPASTRKPQRLALQDTAKARLAGTCRGSPCGIEPKGRKRVAEALKLETDASYMMMARASDESLYKAARGFHAVADRETPYGRIMNRTKLQRDDDSYFCPGVRLPVRVVRLPMRRLALLFPIASYVLGTCDYRVVGVLYG